MTAKLSIECPYLKNNQFRILMHVYYDDANQPINKIIHDTIIRRIRAVEIFAEFLDKDSEASEKKSLFLTTVEEESTLDFHSPDDDKLKWRIAAADGTAKDISAEIKLVLQTRCPLGHKNKDQIKFTFIFDDPQNAAAMNLDNLKKFVCNDYNDFKTPEDGKFRSLDFLLVGDTPPSGTEHSDDRLPTILDFPHFAPGESRRKPKGKRSSWTIKFSNIRKASDRIPLGEKFGLTLGFRKVKGDDGGWWGNGEDTALPLYPLNIAPVGVGTNESDFDFEIFQTCSDTNLSDWIFQEKAEWIMHVHSIYDASFQSNLKYTPLAVWNRFIAEPHFKSLKTVKDGNPGSIIPHFLQDSYAPVNVKRSRKWTMDYTVVDFAPFVNHQLKEEDFSFTLHGIGIAPPDDKNPAQPLIIDVELQNFLDRDGNVVKRRFELSEFDDNAVADTSTLRLFRLAVRDTARANDDVANAQQSRVGALNLHFAKTWTMLSEDLKGTLTADLRGLEDFYFREFNDGALIEHLEDSVPRRCKPAVKAEIPFLLAGLSPGGQDPLPQEIADREERFPDTIIVPLLKNSPNGAPNDGTERGFIKGLFALAAQEESAAQINQSLKLRLEKIKKENASTTKSEINFIVLDQHPFLVAKVSAHISFADEVGNWDDAESFWELQDEGESFNLILPPQAVGEEFIKDYEDFSDISQPSDPDKPFRLRYKFSPPAVFKIMRSNERQNFTETPWNLRRLLGYIKGRERGAGIEQLQYELLFGLTTTVKADFLRLSELNGRLGHLPNLLDEKAPLKIEKKSAKDEDVFVTEYKELQKTFRHQKFLLQSRLALFYPFSVAQKARFLTLNDGVSFHFRTTREVAHPIKTDDELNSDDLRNGFRPIKDGGLRGGVDWGFESSHIHTEVINSKTSSSGKIIAPSFTALGGSGYQKASFALDKSSIYSNTFLGRTFFYSLERIGRIGVLWNRAKHVIVYERTVADTAQFDDTTAKKIWRKIPVVRKVAEYVEILQPERGYPEFGEVPKVRGFVLGSKFEPQARIAVDSKWGRDIAGGWVVPLHNPAAEKDKPTVYPQPNIHLKIATNEETGKAQTWGRITNPEDLYFYTSTNPKDDANTDEWSAVLEIDYPLANVPRQPQAIETHVGGAMDAMLPDPPRIEGGYAPFTFHLDTNKQTANLLVDRLKSPVEAVIENVSMVRRKLEVFQFDGEGDKIRGAVEKAAHDYRSQVETEINAALQKIFVGNADLSGEIDELKKKIQGKIDGAETAFKNLGKTTLQVFQNAQEDLENNWKNAWTQTAARVLKGINESQTVEEAREFLFDLKRQIAAAEFALNETRMKLRRALNEIEDLTKDFSPPIPEIKNRLQAEIRAIKNRLDTEIKKIIAEVDSGTGGDAEKLKTKKARIVVAAFDEFNRWQKFLNELRAKTETLIPDFWQGIDAKASALINALAAPVLTSEQTVRDWLNTVETLFRAYENWLIDLENKIEAPFDLIGKKCTDLEKILDQQVKGIEIFEKETLDKIKSGIEAKINEAKSQVENLFLKPAKAAIETAHDIRDAINKIHGEIENTAAAAKNEIETAAKIAKAVADKLQADLTDETRRAVQGATEAVMGNATKILAPFEKKLLDEARRIDAGVSGDLEKVRAVGERTLRLVRAYGEAPIAEALKLNRERLAYYYGELNEGLSELKNAVAYTPATVLMNRVGRELENLDLKTLGVRLPSKELAEKFVADNLPKFDLKDILPDFAGMKLEKFFSGVKIPQGVSDAVNVAHGIDKQTNRAWAKCDVVMPLDQPVSLFNFGAVEARLVKAHFEAHTSMGADLMNPDRIEKHAEGAITADWHLLILGQVVLTLEKSTLRFDKDGKLKFEMQPASVKLAAPLQFVSDLVRSFNPGKKSGLSFELVTEGMLPVGARAVLNLPLPPLQTGAFAVSHIALRARFEVAAPSGKFYVGLGLSLSSKERPFTLTILCLGGGGWLDVLTVYRPFEETGKLQSRLSIGLAAGADFTFDIGVAAGTVYFLVSLYAEYTVGGGSNLKIALRLSMGGEVSILGIISVNLSLYLEASYESGGTLKCRGELSVSIEICWCFTLEVHQDVEFVLAGGGGGSGNAQALAGNDEVEAAVSDYVNSYGA